MHSVTGGDYSNGVSVDSVKVYIRDDEPQIEITLVGAEQVEEAAGKLHVGFRAVTTEAGIPVSTIFASFSHCGRNREWGRRDICRTMR